MHLALSLSLVKLGSIFEVSEEVSERKKHCAFGKVTNATTFGMSRAWRAETRAEATQMRIDAMIQKVYND
ncbi:unnamed protein product, partial [Brenthis ino]